MWSSVAEYLSSMGEATVLSSPLGLLGGPFGELCKAAATAVVCADN